MGLSHRVTELLEKWLGTNDNPANMQITQNGNTADVVIADGSYGLVTITPGHICTSNSTSTPLGVGGVFTGVATDIINYGVIMVMVKASHPSAIKGLSIQFSCNGIDWDSTDDYTIYANTGKTFSFQTACKYYRIVYTNGDTVQTYFRLSAVIKPYYVKPSSHRVGDIIAEDDDAELTKSVLTAKYDSIFVPINASKSGNLQVTDAENSLAIAKGEVEGHKPVSKFGNAQDFDASDDFVTVWDAAEDGTAWELMRYVYSTTADIDSVSSSDITDNTDFTVVGLDANYNEVTQVITLNGRTRVALPIPLIRVYRAYNSNGTEFVGHIIVYVNTALTAGVPTNKTKIRAVIDPLNQQTLMCVYTVPSGYTGYLTRGYASTSGASKTSEYVLKFYGRQFGGVFRLQNVNAISDTGSSSINLDYNIPLKFPEKTDLEVRVKATASGATACSISAGFDIILVQN